MGATVGAAVDLLVVDRYQGQRAIAATGLIYLVLLGVLCNLLCWRLDHHFHYFGGESNPVMFLLFGAVAAFFGGLLAGWLLFTKRGSFLLERVGI